MCYAIIEVKYQSADVESFNVPNEEALDQRLVTLQNNGQVERIRIFTPTQTLTRTTTWTKTP